MAERKRDPLEWIPPPVDWELVGVIKEGYRPPKRKRASWQLSEPLPQFDWAPPPADPDLVAIIKDGYRPAKSKKR